MNPKHYQNITKERQKELQEMNDEDLKTELFGDRVINSFRSSLLLDEYLYRRDLSFNIKEEG